MVLLWQKIMTNPIWLFVLAVLLGWTQAELETVLLEEVSSGHYYRSIEEILPETMTFNMKRVGRPGYHTLHLAENKRLNQNAPMFEVVKENDQKRLVKKETRPLMNVKFYLDKKNGGSFQAKCMKRSNGPCKRVLFGSLELDNEMYEIMPSPDVNTDQRSYSRDNVATHVLKKVERGQALPLPIIPERAVDYVVRENTDNGQTRREELKHKLREIFFDRRRGNPSINIKSAEKDKRDPNSKLDDVLPKKLDSPSVDLKSILHDKREPPKEIKLAEKDVDSPSLDVKTFMKKHFQRTSQTLGDIDAEGTRAQLVRELKELLALENTELLLKALDSNRQKRSTTTTYALEIAVVMDPTIWEKYSAITSATSEMDQEEATEYRLRQHFSHIINGISLRYEEIEDADMDIYVTVSGFVLSKTADSSSPLNQSATITTVDDVEYVDANVYLSGIVSWAQEASGLPDFPNKDHVMVFTEYDLYAEDLIYNSTAGVAYLSNVCTDYGVSVQEDNDYFVTTSVAAHELGHNLGSDHDGEGTSSDCSASDKYIMSPSVEVFSDTDKYTINPWRFSTCAVEAFKTYVATLGDSNCLLDSGNVFDNDEYELHTSKLPGEIYTLDEQCKLVKGEESSLCNSEDETSERICINMQCLDPVDDLCYFYSAARGSPCGQPEENKWCIDGACVANSTGTVTSATANTPSTTAKTRTTASETIQTTPATTRKITTAAQATSPATTSAAAPTSPTTKLTASPTTTATAAGSSTTASGSSCVDTGYYQYSCEDLDKHYLQEGYTTLQWCPLYKEECCDYCDVEDKPCTNDGHTFESGTHWSCKEIADHFRDDQGYRPSYWCQDPEWNDKCCILCKSI